MKLTSIRIPTPPSRSGGARRLLVLLAGHQRPKESHSARWWLHHAKSLTRKKTILEHRFCMQLVDQEQAEND